MSEKRTKLAVGRAAWLVGVAVGAMVVACDAPAPTEPREAIGRAVTAAAAEAVDPGLANQRGESTLAKWFDSDAAPIVFVDDFRIETREDLPEAVRQWVEGGLRDSDLVAHVHVVKGSGIQGGDFANGAILIFTGREGPDIDPRAVPARPASPPPLVLVDGQPMPWPEIPSSLTRYPVRRAKAFIEDAYYQNIAKLDIESFQIVRGAAAALHYGAEGAGGVILIVTKDSGSGKSTDPVHPNGG